VRADAAQVVGEPLGVGGIAHHGRVLQPVRAQHPLEVAHVQPVGAHAVGGGRQLDQVGPELRRALGTVDRRQATEQVGPPALDAGSQHDLAVATQGLRDGEGGRRHRCSHGGILADLRKRFHTLTVHADASHRWHTGNSSTLAP